MDYFKILKKIIIPYRFTQFAVFISSLNLSDARFFINMIKVRKLTNFKPLKTFSLINQWTKKFT